MEIRALKYFLTAVREGNITKAAKYLNLTQPNLSRQINMLERDIGHKLFERKHNNIELTPEGILLKKRAEEIIDMIEKTRAEFNFTDELIAGDIFIGAGETWAMSLLASIMKDIQETYPHIRYNIYSGNFNDITEIRSNFRISNPIYPTEFSLTVETPLTTIDGTPVYEY